MSYIFPSNKAYVDKFTKNSTIWNALLRRESKVRKE